MFVLLSGPDFPVDQLKMLCKNNIWTTRGEGEAKGQQLDGFSMFKLLKTPMFTLVL